MCVEVRQQSPGVGSLLPSVAPRDQIQAVRLGGEYLTH